MSEYRAFIGPEDPLGRFTRMAIGCRWAEGQTEYLLPNGDRHVMAPGLEPDVDVYWKFPADAGHAILAALSRHLGAVEHPAQLRADYMAERKRVDKLIDSLIQDAP